jgi:hypothetical protein
MKKALAITLAAACLAPWPAFAQQKNLDKAVGILEQQARSGRGEFISFLNGAASAYRWLSADAEGKRPERAYCPPADAALDGRAYAKIAIAEYRRAKHEYAKVPDYPLQVLSLALVRGLGERFPCTTDEPAAAATPAGD